MPNRAASMPATTGRNMRCIAAGSIWRSYQRFRSLAGDDLIWLGVRATGYRVRNDGKVTVSLKTGIDEGDRPPADRG